MKKRKCVFLTRGELQIHSDESLSVHLKPNDARIEEILDLMKRLELQFVTIDPKKISFYKSFYGGNWYLIPSLQYTGRASYSGYIHFSFTYKLFNTHYHDADGVRLLQTHEIERVRKTLSLF